MCLRVLKVPRFDKRGRSNTIKYMSLVFVLVFLIHGVVVIAVSVWMEVSNVSTCKFLQKYYVPIHMQLISGLLTILTCFACFVFTSWRRTSGFIRIFSFLLFIVIVMEIASAITTTVFDSKVNKSQINAGMSISITDITDNSTKVIEAKKQDKIQCWNTLQPQRECCGAKSYMDWVVANQTNSAINGSSFYDILESCECDADKAETCIKWNGMSLFSDGCSKRVSNKLSNTYKVIRILSSVIAIVQCVAFLTLYCFFSKLNKQSAVDVYKAKDLRDTQSPDDLGHM